MAGIFPFIVALIFAWAVPAAAGPFSGADPLRRMVPESFHYKIRNPEVTKHLGSLAPKRLSGDKRLEVLILKGLAEASSEKELAQVFDRLWRDHGEIRDLVARPEKWKAFPHPLACLYYLLSAVPDRSWQEKTVERLYREALLDLTPPQLSGYALHFYTLALLKNFRFEEAGPFLRRLEHFTTRTDYLKNLTLALKYAVEGGSEIFASRLMVAICRTWERSIEPFPGESMKEATLAFKKAGKLELARDALFPLIRKNPKFADYEFVEVLRDTEEILASETVPASEPDIRKEWTTPPLGRKIRVR
jgi:hypothetical protein